MGFKKIMAVMLTSGMVMSFIPATVMADSSNWRKDLYGWKYSDGAGYVLNDWRQDNGKWYYFQHQGYMVFGVDNYLIDGTYYAFDKNGVCLNPYETTKKYYGFHERDFFDVEYYYSDVVIDTCIYYHDPDGKPAKGWREIDGSWYYFDKYDSEMYCEENGYKLPRCVDGNYYWFDEDGKMITGWHNSGSGWHYADEKGNLYIDKWLNDGGNWYYFDQFAYMVSSSENFEINGIDYNFDEDGVCLNPDADSSTHEPGWCKRIVNDYNEQQWFYYNADGSMYTGWLSLGGHWYYLDPDSGAMFIGLNEIDGKNYFFDFNSGVMATGWFVYLTDDYIKLYGYSSADGEIYYNKWIFSGGKWYYADNNGDIVTDLENYMINGIDYNFDHDGVCLNPDATAKTITGWYKRSVDSYGNTAWYYYDPEGMMVTGWRCIGSDWYYFKSDGRMKTGAFRWNSYYYRLRDSGEMVTGWFQYPDKTAWEYYGPDGIRYDGMWLNQNGKWYYFDENGRMLCGCENVLINDIDYSFDIDGVCLNPDAEPQKIVGWFKRYDPYIDSDDHYVWYFYDEDGVMYRNKWLCQGGNWYYFNKWGLMVCDYDCEINGLIYSFDDDGICLNPYDGRPVEKYDHVS